MSDTVFVALVSLAGTLFGSLAGIVASGKLTSFRLTSLEKKMDEYSQIILKFPVIEKEQQSLRDRIFNLEGNARNGALPS